MTTAERARHFPEIFLHRALSAALLANGWQVREELSYLTKRFDIVAFKSGVLICVEVKTREFRRAISQLATSRLIFHQVFVALSQRHANEQVMDACKTAQCGLLSVGAPPLFESNLMLAAPWCNERLDPHTQQVLRIAGFKS